MAAAAAAVGPSLEELAGRVDRVAVKTVPLPCVFALVAEVLPFASRIHCFCVAEALPLCLAVLRWRWSGSRRRCRPLPKGPCQGSCQLPPHRAQGPHFSAPQWPLECPVQCRQLELQPPLIAMAALNTGTEGGTERGTERGALKGALKGGTGCGGRSDRPGRAAAAGGGGGRAARAGRSADPCEVIRRYGVKNSSGLIRAVSVLVERSEPRSEGIRAINP